MAPASASLGRAATPFHCPLEISPSASRFSSTAACSTSYSPELFPLPKSRLCRPFCQPNSQAFRSATASPHQWVRCARTGRSRSSVVVQAMFAGLGGEKKAESIPLEQLQTEEDLDGALAEAQAAGQPIIVDWMASWCRKCIYLKPKMERLAAEFPKVKFYFVDVNAVPAALVKRGRISKMPTIQLWKSGEQMDEVIGGHKAWMVIDEVREMVKASL